jgi:outer membrane protein assembly factor BamD
MQSRYIASVAMCAILIFSSSVAIFAQQSSSAQSDATPTQRLEIMRSRLETMRRSLNSAIAATNADDDGQKKKDKKDAATTATGESRARLRGLEQEASSLIAEVYSTRTKVDRRERLDDGVLDKLDAAVADLDTRVQAGLSATRGERSANAASDDSKGSGKKKKKGGIISRLLGRGDDDKYEELTGTVAPGRDRVLFEEATKQVRKGSYDTGRLLFNTIITTYPDSPFLPLSKLAIGDSFYLEGTSAALIQAGGAYQDWLTFFPTDPLADDVMLKIAESEMRQMGLADRDVTHARKAEQRLKVLMQQFPNTSLRQEVEQRVREVQENLATHSMKVGDFYYERNRQEKGGLKGAQSRYREVAEKYPYFSYMDKVLYRLANTYLQEEEPDEAAKFFQRIVRDYPNSQYAQKAREQLEVIGAEVPTPNPQRVNMVEPERPGFVGNLVSEFLGSVEVTVNKNGILISKDKNEGNDLIDKAIQRGGILPDDATPAAPVQRTAPARTFTQTAPPATTPANQTNGNGTPQPGQSPGGSGTTTTPAPQPAPPQSATPATNTTTTAPATSTGTNP